jgi:hypothetical protein
MKKNLLNLRTLATALLIGAASSFSFAQITTLPVIDGDGSDAVWATAPAFSFDSVISDTNVTSADDLSGTFKVLWSVDSLYILIEENDDILDVSTATPDAETYYLNDHVSVYIDAFNKKTAAYESSQEFYEFYFDETSTVKGRKGLNWAAPGGQHHVNTITEGTGYVCEIAISWAEYGFKPFAGSLVGFDALLNDNDGTGRAILTWFDLTDGTWGNPGAFGNIYLNRDGSVSGVKASDAAITVDGKADDAMWLNAETWDITTLVHGNVGDITNDNDYSGIAKFLWTADSLYVFYSIKDDILYTGDANAYANDNATIAIDLFNKKSATYGTNDTSQHFWEIYWYDLVESGKTGPISYKKIIDEGTGYTLEAAIPFAASNYVPGVDKIIGVDVKLNENDGNGRDQLTYNDTTDNIWQYPSVFGSAKLAVNGKVHAIATPLKPNPVVTVTESDVNITWTADPNAAEYVLYKDGVELATQSTLTYDDNGLANGSYKYSVQAVSSEGAISPMSSQKTAKVEVTGVNNPLTSDVKVYPNPAQNEINISNNDLINSLAIMSITGQVVARVNDINATSYKFDLNGVNSGLYILSVQTENGTSLVKITVK